VVARGPGEEDVAEPGTKIVDGGDEADVRRTRMMERNNKARMDEDAGQNTDIVAKNYTSAL